jgi:hypothetical protein
MAKLTVTLVVELAAIGAWILAGAPVEGRRPNGAGPAPAGIGINRSAKADRLSPARVMRSDEIFVGVHGAGDHGTDAVASAQTPSRTSLGPNATVVAKSPAPQRPAAQESGTRLAPQAPAARQPAMPEGCTSAFGVLVRQPPDRWLGTCFTQLAAPLAAA